MVKAEYSLHPGDHCAGASCDRGMGAAGRTALFLQYQQRRSLNAESISDEPLNGYDHEFRRYRTGMYRAEILGFQEACRNCGDDLRICRIRHAPGDRHHRYGDLLALRHEYCLFTRIPDVTVRLPPNQHRACSRAL